MADVRLIDANAALKDLCGSQCGCWIDECGFDEPCEKARCIIRQPTIEAEPVKHGEWRVLGYTALYCTECNVGIPVTLVDGFSYCPFCGAKMDGGAD